MSESRYLFKIVVTGSPETNIIRTRLISTEDLTKEEKSLGSSVRPITLPNVQGESVKLIYMILFSDSKIWKRTPTYVHPSGYHGANGGLIFFDSSSRNSFEQVRSFHSDHEHYIRDPIPIFLIGLLSDSPTINSDEANELANELKLDYYELSPHDNDTWNAIQRSLATRILKRYGKIL